MRRRQWAWVAAMGGSVVFFLACAKYAYDVDALGASGFVRAVGWALTVIAPLAGALGVLGTIRESSTSAAFRIVNSLWGRLVTVGLSLGVGLALLIAALRVSPPPTWACAVVGRKTGPADRSRCGAGTFAQMRSFQLRLTRASDASELPTLRAKAADRAAGSVALDSDRGGLCVATGPDRPTFGESQLALSADCGADRVYPVNLHLCDVAAASTPLAAAVHLELREGNHAIVIACD